MNSLSSCPHFVYELVDPRDTSIFYVGITVHLYERYKEHMHADGTNPQKDQRLQEIVASGYLPIMRTIEQVATRELALLREQYWIKYYLKLDIPIVNVAAVPGRAMRGPRIIRRFPRNRHEPKAESIGRARKHSDTIALLTSVHETGIWPDNVSPQMQRYYRREYPEFFTNTKKSAKLRLSHGHSR